VRICNSKTGCEIQNFSIEEIFYQIKPKLGKSNEAYRIAAHRFVHFHGLDAAKTGNTTSTVKPTKLESTLQI
jgi:hypothetical protein